MTSYFLTKSKLPKFSNFSKPKTQQQLSNYTTKYFNSLILSSLHSKKDPKTALSLYSQLLSLNLSPDHLTFPLVLKASILSNSISQSAGVPARIVRTGHLYDSHVLVSLISFFFASADPTSASTLFNSYNHKNPAPYNAMICGFVSNCRCIEAFGCFRQMLGNGISMDEVSAVSALRVAVRWREESLVKSVHGVVLKSGIVMDCCLGANLIGGYMKCGVLDDARQVFDCMSQRNLVCYNVLVDGLAKGGDVEHARRVFDEMVLRDIVSWNAMIGGYVAAGFAEEGIRLFKALLADENLQPNMVTFLSVIVACVDLEDIELGKWVHRLMEERRIEWSLQLCNAIINMYSKCDQQLDVLKKVFDEMPRRDVVSWNTFFACLLRAEQYEDVLQLYGSMVSAGHVEPDEFTIAPLIKASACLKKLTIGKRFHGYVVKVGMLDEGLIGNSLIEMYGKCEQIDDAAKVFESNRCRDLNSYKIVLDCYVHNNQFIEAFVLFNDMLSNGIPLDRVTAACLVSACSQLGDMRLGRVLHAHIVRAVTDVDVVVYNSLITMYARCGEVARSSRVFELIDLQDRSVSTWSAMIGGYAMNGCSREAIEVFMEMEKVGHPPDDITFLEVLSACRHSGLVYEGCYFFDLMHRKYCIAPSAEHYSCIVDLLARAGCVDKADEILRNTPMKATDSAIGALLGACRIHGNVELADRVIERLGYDARNDGIHVLVSNIYADSKRWNRVEDVRSMMREQVTKKMDSGRSVVSS